MIEKSVAVITWTYNIYLRYLLDYGSDYSDVSVASLPYHLDK